MRGTRSEILDLILVTLVLGFCFSFRDWGVEAFSVGTGLRNFFLVLLLTAFSVGIHELSHEFIGQRYGVRVLTKTWKPVLLIALLVTFLTNGWIVFATVWSIIIISPTHRLGRKANEVHAGPYERAKIALTGPVVNIIILIVAGFLYSVNPLFIFQKLMFINGTLAVFNLFPFFRFVPLLLARPTGKMVGERMKALHKSLMNLQKHKQAREIPFMEGELVFFGSRPIWAFLFSFSFFFFFVLMTSKEWLSSLISGLVFAVIMYFLWLFFLEPWSYEYSTKSKKPRPW